MGIVLGALGDLGYGFAYRVLDAQHFGVPQRRRRVFIVGCLGDSGRAPTEVLALSEGLRGHLEESDKKRKATARKVAVSTGSGSELTGGGQTLYGETGFAKYTENQLKTLNETQHKRGTENVVVCESQTSADS